MSRITPCIGSEAGINVTVDFIPAGECYGGRGSLGLPRYSWLGQGRCLGRGSALRSQRTLRQAGVPHPSESAIRKAISREEMIRHCRRTTRGTETTTREIESLLLALSSATDALGVPLLREETAQIWEEQRHHIPCLQDPPNVCLYTITGHITKGGVELPLLRCACGSTSLESFHLHLARFIPGSSAGPVSYQAYLLDGITRWNSARAAAAIQSPAENLRSFDARLQEKVSLIKYTHPV